MTALGINNPNSYYNRNERRHALHVPAQRITGNDITRGELESLEMIVNARLNLALFHRAPVVRIQELQKQLWLLKIEKSGMQS